MTRLEVYQFLISFFAGLKNTTAPQVVNGAQLQRFFDLVLSLKRDLPVSIPLLRALAALTRAEESKEENLIKRRIDRRYRRLCRVQEELGRLDFKKAAPHKSPGTALEDFVFSQIDFSRYMKMDEQDFEQLFPEGLTDFDEVFLQKSFGCGKTEIQSLITASYKKTDGTYRIQTGDPGKEPLILSVMRTLETSLETLPLFTAGETEEELKSLLNFVEGSGEKSRRRIPGMERLFPLLVSGLDNALIPHGDGMTTKLFISPRGDLSGTFRPGNKPWTIVLIPAQSPVPDP